MTIHLIARELYRKIREVEALEKRMGQTAVGQEGVLEDRLRKLKAERDRLKGMIDRHKKKVRPVAGRF